MTAPLFECDACGEMFPFEEINENDLCNSCEQERKTRMLDETGEYFKGREKNVDL